MELTLGINVPLGPRTGKASSDHVFNQMAEANMNPFCARNMKRVTAVKKKPTDLMVNDRNFPCQTLKIRKVSGLVMGS
jgi:hypothetical protein